jgi:hypothetical protein
MGGQGGLRTRRATWLTENAERVATVMCEGG